MQFEWSVYYAKKARLYQYPWRAQVSKRLFLFKIVMTLGTICPGRSRFGLAVVYPVAGQAVFHFFCFYSIRVFISPCGIVMSFRLLAVAGYAKAVAPGISYCLIFNINRIGFKSIIMAFGAVINILFSQQAVLVNPGCRLVIFRS